MFSVLGWCAGAVGSAVASQQERPGLIPSSGSLHVLPVSTSVSNFFPQTKDMLSGELRDAAKVCVYV